MNQTSSNLEIIDDNKLREIVTQNGLPIEAIQSLRCSFAPLFKKAADLLAQSKAVVVTDASQVAQINLSRVFRLELRKIRIAGESRRRELKEESLRRGRAIDGFQNILEELIGAEETRLAEGEKIVERAEAARKTQLKIDREAALKPFGIDTTFYALADMTDEAWAQLLENSQAAHARKQEEARVAQEEKIRAENERLRKAEEMRLENLRLKREAEEREAAIKAEMLRQQEELMAKVAREEEEERVARIERLRVHDARLSALAPFITTEEYTATPLLHYGPHISDEHFTAMLEQRKKQKAARDRQDAIAEEERVKALVLKEAIAKATREKADAEAKATKEREFLEAKAAQDKADAAARMAEQKRLADEAAETQRQEGARKMRVAADKARKEREELARQAEVARAAQERAEAEAKAVRDAEAKRLADEAEAKRKAALAPEREKLSVYAICLRGLLIPALDSEGGILVVDELRARVEKLAKWVEVEAQRL